MSFLASFSAALIPMAVYLILLWRSDRYEREPIGKVIKHFIWGAVGAIVLGFIFSYIFNFSTNLIISGQQSLAFVGSVITAPLIEETVKSIYLFRSYKKEYFDNLTDGLVYGAAIGLGFGMTENLLYFTIYDNSFNEWISVVFMRSLFSAVMHGISTAVVGAFLAKVKFSKVKFSFTFILFGLLLAMGIHSLWNFSMTFEFTFLFGILFMTSLIISFIALFKYSLNKEMKIIMSELYDELSWLKIRFNEKSKRINFIQDDAKFITRSNERKYINFATKLAFRKLQAKNCNKLNSNFYLTDIEMLKQKLKNLLLNI